MKLSIKKLKNENPETYYQYTLVDIQFINTFQVWSVNLTIFNYLIQIIHDKNNSKINKMIKHKALLVQEGLAYDELTDRIKNKIQRYNSIENSKESKYKMAFGKNKGQQTQRAISEMTELDEDICDLLNDFINSKEEDAQQQQQQQAPPQPPVDETPKPEEPKSKPFLGWW